MFDLIKSISVSIYLDINDELKQIEKRLGEIRKEINLLETERENLILRKLECNKSKKDLMPSSSGGNKNDVTSNWNRAGTFKYLKINRDFHWL